MNLDGTLENHEIEALVAYFTSTTGMTARQRETLWMMVPHELRTLVIRDAMTTLRKQDPVVWQHIADFDK
jgi:hypothetical protein